MRAVAMPECSTPWRHGLTAPLGCPARRSAVALLKRLQQTQTVLLAMRHMLPSVPEAEEAVTACEVRWRAGWCLKTSW
jgi:hypothetical protein